MTEVPKVAVITRTRNRPCLLKRAIQSVVNQSFEDWQHVIINDGGDKEPLEALCDQFKKAYAGRLVLIHQGRTGMQKASNKAIRQSESTYIVIHDDDDSWDPEFLKKTTALLDKAGPKSNFQGVISKTIKVLEKEEPDGSFVEIERKPYVPLDNISFFRIGYENPFAPIAFLYRRSVHDAIGMFDPRWDMVADLDFNYRFLQKFDVAVVSQNLAFYHWREESLTAINRNSVTAKKKKHGELLNSLRNLYLRHAESAREAAHALSFQISTYAVENQWMTAEIRERAIAAKSQLEGIQKEVEALTALGNKELLPRLADLAPVRNELAELAQFNDREVWPKLTKEILPRLENLINASLQIAPIHQQVVDLKEQVQLLRVFNDKTVWPKLVEEILPRLDGLLADAARIPAIQQELGLVGERLESLQRSDQETLWPKLDALTQDISRLKTLLDGLKEGGEQHGDALRTVRDEISALREVSSRQWKIGRIRLEWLPRAGEGDGESKP
jgi:GT2 family glycosyltransferase